MTPTERLRDRVNALTLSDMLHNHPYWTADALLDGLNILARASDTDGCTRGFLVQDAEGFWPVVVREAALIPRLVDDGSESNRLAILGFGHGCHPTILDALLALLLHEGTTGPWNPGQAKGGLVADFLLSGHPEVPTVEAMLALGYPDLSPMLAVRDSPAR